MSDDVKKEMLEDITLDFTNCEGRVIHIRDNMTLGEMTELGMRVSIGPKNAPLKPNEYVHFP